jgi:hypothetical protein
MDLRPFSQMRRVIKFSFAISNFKITSKEGGIEPFKKLLRGTQSSQ